MLHTKNDGFTILELVLFIAISTMMLIIAFTAISGRVQDVQFTDSLRTLESQLRRNLSHVGFGLNMRGDIDCEQGAGELDFPSGGLDTPPIGANLNCVANGVLLTFDQPESLKAQAVATYAEADEEVDPGNTSLEDLLERLDNGQISPIPGTEQDVPYHWQVEYIGGGIFEGDVNPEDTFDVVQFKRLRIIDGSTEYLFVRTDPSLDYQRIAEDEEYLMCFEGENDRRAGIAIGSESRFQANLDEERCENV